MAGISIPAPSSVSVTALTGTPNRVVYVDASGNVQEVALGAAGEVLTSAGAAAAPEFGPLGTNVQITSLIGSADSVVYVDAAGAVQELALGSAGQVLTSQGAGAAPTFETPTDEVGVSLGLVVALA